MAQLMNIRVTNRESKALRLIAKHQQSQGDFAPNLRNTPEKAVNPWITIRKFVLLTLSPIPQVGLNFSPGQSFLPPSHLQVTVPLSPSVPSAPWDQSVCCS